MSAGINGEHHHHLAGKKNEYVNCCYIILDFFSGSATTAHAVLMANLIDNIGKRKFIMVQIPENLDESLERATGDDKKDIEFLISFLDSIGKPHFVTEIGKERIRRAGKKIKEEHDK